MYLSSSIDIFENTLVLLCNSGNIKGIDQHSAVHNSSESDITFKGAGSGGGGGGQRGQLPPPPKKKKKKKKIGGGGERVFAPPPPPMCPPDR